MSWRQRLAPSAKMTTDIVGRQTGRVSRAAGKYVWHDNGKAGGAEQRSWFNRKPQETAELDRSFL